MTRCLRQHQVAAKLAVSIDWFYRNKKRLIAEEGFPAPVPGLGQVWLEEAVDTWLTARAAGAAPKSIPFHPVLAGADASAGSPDLAGELAARATKLARSFH